MFRQCIVLPWIPLQDSEQWLTEYSSTLPNKVRWVTKDLGFGNTWSVDTKYNQKDLVHSLHCCTFLLDMDAEPQMMFQMDSNILLDNQIRHMMRCPEDRNILLDMQNTSQ